MTLKYRFDIFPYRSFDRTVTKVGALTSRDSAFEDDSELIHHFNADQDR
jgi:hypothetical protein